MVNGTKNTNYLIAVAMMVMVTITAAVIVQWQRPDKDNTAIIAIIFAFATQILMQVLGTMRVQEKVHETHVLVNSEMEKFRQSMQEAALGKVQIARHEGKEAGREAAAAEVKPPAPAVEIQVVEHQVVEKQSVKKESL